MDEIISEFENVFQKKFVRGHSKIKIAQFEAPCAFSTALVKDCNIELGNYLNTVIKKYYPPFYPIV